MQVPIFRNIAFDRATAYLSTGYSDVNRFARHFTFARKRHRDFIVGIKDTLIETASTGAPRSCVKDIVMASS